MKKSLYALIVLVVSIYSTTGNKTEGSEIADKCLMDVFWNIDQNLINTFHTEEDNFYKLVGMYEHDNTKTLEGEKWQRLYMLIGEYGEIPEGELRDLGLFHHVITTDFENEKRKLTIVHGPVSNPDSTVIYF